MPKGIFWLNLHLSNAIYHMTLFLCNPSIWGATIKPIYHVQVTLTLEGKKWAANSDKRSIFLTASVTFMFLSPFWREEKIKHIDEKYGKQVFKLHFRNLLSLAAFTIDSILYGIHSISIEYNYSIITAVHKFIIDT